LNGTNELMTEGAHTLIPEREHKLFSVGRTWAIANNTFTQLVRMKVFYFMLIFSALIIGVNFFFLNFTFEQELKILKDVSFGAMSLFASVFAIVGTALLIPKDIEDRTLYTILTKPVPRFEYLLGKLLGILLLIGVSLVLMSLLFFAVLYLRQHQILAQEIASSPTPPGEAQVAALREAIFAQGLQASLLVGVLAVFLKAAVAAGVALVVSTFASSTLFTIIVSMVVYFIGHTVSMARDYWFPDGGEHSPLGRVAAGLIAIPFPDFQLFNVIDGLVTGQVVSAFLMARLVGLTLFYLTIYTLVSWFIFAKKEL
jgi:ABC-type transport system involved in multi-copper enzyme maturation permease subunit